jgi:cobalt-zinc-cadmium efflux system membrane fusion protein
MNRRFRGFLKFTLGVIVLVVLAGAAMHFLPQVRQRLMAVETETASKDADDPASSAQLVSGQPGTISLPEDVVHRLRVTTCTAEPAQTGAVLELSGTLMFDTNRLSHVHTRFPGEITEVGTVAGTDRPIDFGERVHKDQLLCVLWSRDLGEKKSELIDALSQLHLDKQTFDRLTESSKDGAIPERTVREARRRVETDDIAVSRCLRTLQSWRVPKEEIDAVQAEAERYYSGKKDSRETRAELVHQWARLEIHSPLDGVVVERNAVLGDLVDVGVDLFMIADLSRLRVSAHAYEEDLPKLDALKENQRRWAIRVANDPNVAIRSGEFVQIGRVIDPNQHTALVMGWVPNADDRLRVGQFITAEITLPRPENEVAVPAGALVEQGDQKFVVLQPDEKQYHYTRCQIAMARRSGTTVYVRRQISPDEERRGLKPLAAGQRVVSSGAVPLLQMLTELESATASAGK